MLFAILGGSGAIVILLVVILVVILSRPKPVPEEYEPKNKVAEIGVEQIEDFSDD